MLLELEVNCEIFCTCKRSLKATFAEEPREVGYELHVEPCSCRKGVKAVVSRAYYTGLERGKRSGFQEGYDRACASISAGKVKLV